MAKLANNEITLTNGRKYSKATDEIIVINGRKYSIGKENQVKNIKKNPEMDSDTPLKQDKHAELPNKLQKYDLDKIDENELEEILPLVL